ncbi:MAG: histidine kinase [Cyanobacteria bacterium P01_A01_bin.105]
MKTSTPLSFLLFVKRRSRAAEQIRQIRHGLQQLSATQPFDLEVVDVREQPYLVEYFRLVATPALVRVSDTDNQVLAGDDIVSQVEYWLPRWQQELEGAAMTAVPEAATSSIDRVERTAEADDVTTSVLSAKRTEKIGDEGTEAGADVAKIDTVEADPEITAPEIAAPEIKTHDRLGSQIDVSEVADETVEKLLEADSPLPSKSSNLEFSNLASSNPGTTRSTETPQPPSISRAFDILRLSDEIFQLKQAQEELKDQLDFKDRIIAMMAHDLRNPLTAASIAIDTLEMGFNPDRQRRVPMRPRLTVQLLRNAKSQIRTIDNMIADILSMARRADGSMRIQPRPTELKPLCLAALTSIETKVKSKQQTIEMDIPQDLPQIYADAEQIRRLVTNLLENAVKYTPDHGVIRLTALHRTTQKIQISLQDTGPGIPESQQGQIFEERFRLKRDRQQDGYGIGLALCRRIVQAHFGKIWVDSLPGEGSTFHVILPVYYDLQALM